MPNVNYGTHVVSDQIVRDALHRLADALNRDIRVTSGDRTFVPPGGSYTSDHLSQRAADFRVEGMSNAEVFAFMQANATALFGGAPPFQIIQHGQYTETDHAHLHIGHHPTLPHTVFKVEGLTPGTHGIYHRVGEVPLTPGNASTPGQSTIGSHSLSASEHQSHASVNNGKTSHIDIKSSEPQHNPASREEKHAPEVTHQTTSKDGPTPRQGDPVLVRALSAMKAFVDGTGIAPVPSTGNEKPQNSISEPAAQGLGGSVDPVLARAFNATRGSLEGVVLGPAFQSLKLPPQSGGANTPTAPQSPQSGQTSVGIDGTSTTNKSAGGATNGGSLNGPVSTPAGTAGQGSAQAAPTGQAQQTSAYGDAVLQRAVNAMGAVNAAPPAPSGPPPPPVALP